MCETLLYLMRKLLNYLVDNSRIKKIHESSKIWIDDMFLQGTKFEIHIYNEYKNK